MGHFMNRTYPRACRQRGIVLFVALIALVVLSLGAVATVRAIDATGMIAGNMAFKQASTEATHIGIGLALQTLSQTVNRDQSNPARGYFSFLADLSASDVPPRSAWTSLRCYAADAISQPVVVDCADASRYRVQFVIERLCKQTPVTDATTQCISAPPADDGSKEVGAVELVTPGQVHYRVTVRVRGPRNALSVAQAVLAY